MEGCSKTGIASQEPSLWGDRIHNFYTEVLILTLKAIIRLDRVQVDSRCPCNLLPQSITKSLNLIMYSCRQLAIMIAKTRVHTHDCYQFTIRVAGLDTRIVAIMIPGLHPWFQNSNLLSDPRTRKYYIPVPL